MYNPTETIYKCLGSAFWTKRKCSNCQKPFSLTDYQNHNYQLFFKEVGNIQSTTSLNQAVLAGVIVSLFHKYCLKFKPYPNECQFEFIKDIICK